MVHVDEAHPTITLEPADRAQLLDLVKNVCAAEIAPLLEHPERPASSTDIRRVLKTFSDLGIVSTSDDRELGLWDHPTVAESRSLSVDMLRNIASASPAIAYLMHTQATARWLDHIVGFETGTSTVSFDRTTPAGGRAFGKSVAGFALDHKESQALAAAWVAAPQQPIILSLDLESWQSLWHPVWCESSGWRLHRLERSQLAVATSANFHGLDELTVELSRVENTQQAASAHLDQRLTLLAMSIHGLGLLAIASGAAERAIRQARDYAKNRTQGGSTIIDHDAVVQLLEQAQQAITVADPVLENLCHFHDDAHRLIGVWRARSHLHPALATAGSNALQVFGGIGYMRDMGAEKVLRDLNTLRRLGGSPSELTLRCADVHTAFPANPGAAFATSTKEAK